MSDSAGAVIPGLLGNPATAELGKQAAAAFTEAAATASFGAAAFLAIALVASSFLRGTRVGDESEAA